MSRDHQQKVTDIDCALPGGTCNDTRKERSRSKGVKVKKGAECHARSWAGGELSPWVEEGELGPWVEEGKLGPWAEEGELGPWVEEGELCPLVEEGKLGPWVEEGELGPLVEEGKLGVEEGELGPLVEEGKVPGWRRESFDPGWRMARVPRRRRESWVPGWRRTALSLGGERTRWHVAVVKDPFVLYVSPWQVGTARPYDKGRHIKMRPQGSGAFPTEPPPGTSAGMVCLFRCPVDGVSPGGQLLCIVLVTRSLCILTGTSREATKRDRDPPSRVTPAVMVQATAGSPQALGEREEVADPIEEKLWAGDGPAVGRPMFVHTVVTSWRAWARRACQ
ncbi:unnamed protein product [Gadus morhua 'NCC']